MLGAGFVTKPTLDILSESGVQVTVGTQSLSPSSSSSLMRSPIWSPEPSQPPGCRIPPNPLPAS